MAHERGFGHWVLWIIGTTGTIVVLAFLSLLVTSDGLSFDQHRMVNDAIAVVEKGGFDRDTTVLRHVVFFRSSENWWNRYVGHENAYAATNFPFAVVTLYPAFFKVPVDATERASILLHESQHVFGVDEATALQRVWLGKGRLGWTAQNYSRTRVWRNTREWTKDAAPVLFRCGADQQSDCVE